MNVVAFDGLRRAIPPRRRPPQPPQHLVVVHPADRAISLNSSLELDVHPTDRSNSLNSSLELNNLPTQSLEIVYIWLLKPYEKAGSVADHY